MSIGNRLGLWLCMLAIYIVVWRIADAVSIDIDPWERVVLSICGLAGAAIFVGADGEK